ncbi:MAG TPA: MFS transporter [Ktedonobacteraceae bacterium]|nr:MFS transporter [Ktedonobacteraceae bacterium]
MDAEVTSASPVTPSLWKNRDYILLWSGQAVSTVGTSVTNLALPLLILTLTESPVWVGVAGALGSIPYVIFSLIAGALVDRWDRKRVMITCDIGRALALGSMVVALIPGYLTIWHIVLVALIINTLFVFFNIAEAACLPQVVAKEQLPDAVAQNQAAMSSSFLIGPSLGGFLYSLGNALPFVLDMISYIVSAVSLFFIKRPLQQERPAKTQSSSIWADIKDGLVWLWQNPLVRHIAFLTSGMNMFLAGQVLLTIVIAQRLQAPSYLIGLILAIGGIGSIVGSLIAPKIQKKFSFGQVIISIPWLFAGFCLLYILVPFSLLLGVIAAGFFLLGPIYNVVQYSYRLALIPDEFQGRVNSSFRLIAFGAQPLGALLMGTLLQLAGPSITVLVFTSLLALLALLTSLNPLVRHARPLAELAVKSAT